MTRLFSIVLLHALLVPAAASAQGSMFGPGSSSTQSSNQSLFGPRADPLNTEGTCLSGTGGNYFSGGSGSSTAPSTGGGQSSGSSSVLAEIITSTPGDFCYLMGGMYASMCTPEYWMNVMGSQSGFGLESDPFQLGEYDNFFAY